MAVTQSFIESVSELFAFVAELRAKRMFGAAAFYSGDAIFTLADDDQVWLKVDDESSPRFEAEGLEQFVYGEKDGKPLIMAYRRAPEAIWDDPDTAREWANLAIGAALRGKARKAARKPGRKGS
jgi:DNA transformation protein